MRVAIETSVSEELKIAREAMGFSVDDAAAQTKIKARYIDAIENKLYADLPLRVYTVGFVKTYARLLGLDDASIGSRFLIDAGQYLDEPEWKKTDPPHLGLSLLKRLALQVSKVAHDSRGQKRLNPCYPIKKEGVQQSR